MRVLFTAGVYGTTEATFFGALRGAQVDLLVDIRRRRVLRGGRFPWANAVLLQRRLGEQGVGYVHRLDLAPTETVRDVQKRIDAERKTAKADRAALDPAFVRAYHDEVLAGLDPVRVLGELFAGAGRPCLFCVEGRAAACHRSLVAGWLLRADPELRVEHLEP